MPVSSCRYVFLTVMSDTVSDIDSIRHNSKEHISTGRHGHNLIPNACSHISYISVHVRLDILPEDGPLGTETCRSFIGIFSILMCVNIF
jgi:hypothetical protein